MDTFEKPGLVDHNGHMVDEVHVRAWLATIVKTNDPIVEIVLVDPKGYVSAVYQRPDTPFTMSPLEMVGQRLQDLDLHFTVCICAAQARALNTAIPTTYEWRLDDTWIVRTLIVVPRPDHGWILYIQHRGTRPAIDPPTFLMWFLGILLGGGGLT